MKPNILFVCLDSVRYDTFTAANTPNMNKIGETLEAYSFSCWTLPSIMGYLLDFPPIGTGKKSLFYPLVTQWNWVPKQLTNKRYATAWFSSNAGILALDNTMDGWFGKWFKYFKALEYQDSAPSKTERIIRDIASIVELEQENPIFVFTLLMDTHRPYYFGGGGCHDIDPSRPAINFENQKRAIEYVDRVFPRLIAPFKKLGKRTRVFITSDHGELFGPEFWSHDPSTLHIRFDPKLYQIPFIRGEVGEK